MKRLKNRGNLTDAKHQRSGYKIVSKVPSPGGLSAVADTCRTTRLPARQRSRYSLPRLSATQTHAASQALRRGREQWSRERRSYKET